MARGAQSQAVGEIVSETGRFLRHVEASTETFGALLDHYGKDPEAFESALEDLRDLESRCDATVGDLRSLVGSSMDPNFTGLYLMSDTLVEFYETTDTVVNNAESFGNDLAAMEPALSPELRDDLRQMAAFAHDATTHLSLAGTTQFESLADPDARVDVSRDAEQIRALEGRCDDVRFRILDRAFDSREPVDALLVREFTSSLESVTDAAEDASDRLVYMNRRQR